MYINYVYILCIFLRTLSKDKYYYYYYCLATFPGMFGDTPQNVLGHSPEHSGNIPIPASPAFRSPSLYSWFYT